MPEACITVRSQKMGLDHATVRSRVFWGLRYSPVPNFRTGPYRSPDWTGLQNHTSVRSQNSGPDCLQISPVRSGPSPTVRSGQFTLYSTLYGRTSENISANETGFNQSRLRLAINPLMTLIVVTRLMMRRQSQKTKRESSNHLSTGL